MIKFLQTNSARLLFILVFSACISSYNCSFSQASFTTVCPQKKIGKNDYVQVQFMVANAANVETIIPPSFRNFSVISGPNQESSMTTVNGKVDQYVSISYFLKPTSTGKFTIGSATAKADGKEFHSAPVIIEVINAPSVQGSNSPNSLSAFGSSPFGNLNFDLPAQPSVHRFDDYILKKGENINDKVAKNLFVKLEVDKTSCYVGEPIVASYKLYTRLRSESTVTSAPSFNGFSVSELQLSDNNASSNEKYNGRDYNIYTLRKVQLYPLQAGTITLDPVVADNKITFLKAEYANAQNGNMFLDMMQNFADATSPQDAIVEKHASLQSKAVTIEIKPLPMENQPADFKGAVGNFTIESSLQKDNITTDDAGNLKVDIAGNGNIQLVNAPKINWPDGIDGYDAKITDAIDKFSVPMKGSKTFIYPFTGSRAGSYNIPSISFSFFEPSTSTYKTVTTKPFSINIKKGKGVPNNTYAGNKIAGAPVETNVFNKYGIYFLPGAVFIAILILWNFQKKSAGKKKELSAKVEPQVDKKELLEKAPEFIIPGNPLEEAHEKLTEENSVAFYSVLDNSFKKYLSAKFKVPAEELTKKRLYEELDKCNVSVGTSHLLSSLMEDVELNLYAPPSTATHLKETYEKASEVISLIDKQVC